MVCNFTGGMKPKLTICLLLVLFIALIMTEPALAQCPMCKMSAESSLKEGSKHALGLNSGILYLLAFPYALCTTLFLLWYRQHRKNKLAVR